MFSKQTEITLLSSLRLTAEQPRDIRARYRILLMILHVLIS